nr:MAG TPA: hypothetical protein [Caudoviricetes sp.]
MSIKGYKAFNKGMICKGKQYEENTTYEENGNKICKAGVMHFCENPFDVLNYYPLIDKDGNISDFADVEAIGDIYKEKDKTATNKLHIGAKLGLKGFIKACVDFTIEKTKVETVKADDVGISSGDSAQIGSGGDYAQIGSSGDYAQIGSSGDSAKIGSGGDYAQIGSSGDSAQITSEGNNSVVMAAGCNSIAKAKIGSWITLAEWIRTDKANDSGNYIWIPKCVKTEYVDGERIKEDIFYKLVDGEFKEVGSED